MARTELEKEDYAEIVRKVADAGYCKEPDIDAISDIVATWSKVVYDKKVERVKAEKKVRGEIEKAISNLRQECNYYNPPCEYRNPFLKRVSQVSADLSVAPIQNLEDAISSLEIELEALCAPFKYLRVIRKGWVTVDEQPAKTFRKKGPQVQTKREDPYDILENLRQRIYVAVNDPLYKSSESAAFVSTLNAYLKPYAERAMEKDVWGHRQENYIQDVQEVYKAVCFHLDECSMAETLRENPEDISTIKALIALRISSPFRLAGASSYGPTFVSVENIGDDKLWDTKAKMENRDELLLWTSKQWAISGNATFTEDSHGKTD